MSKLTDQDLDAIEGRVNPATQPEDIYSLLADLREARARIAALEAEVARMRPVVEAARARRNAASDYIVGANNETYQALKHAAKAEDDAFNIFDAAQKAAREG